MTADYCNQIYPPSQKPPFNTIWGYSCKYQTSMTFMNDIFNMSTTYIDTIRINGKDYKYPTTSFSASAFLAWWNTTFSVSLLASPVTYNPIKKAFTLSTDYIVGGIQSILWKDNINNMFTWYPIASECKNIDGTIAERGYLKKKCVQEEVACEDSDEVDASSSDLI
jgi:hypothetical protein